MLKNFLFHWSICIVFSLVAWFTFDSDISHGIKLQQNISFVSVNLAGIAFFFPIFKKTIVQQIRIKKERNKAGR